MVMRWPPVLLVVLILACGEPPNPCPHGTQAHDDRCRRLTQDAAAFSPFDGDVLDGERVGEPDVGVSDSGETDVGHTILSDASLSDGLTAIPAPEAALPAHECSADDLDRWRAFHASDAAVTTISACVAADPRCLVESCPLDTCLREQLGISGCKGCVAGQVACVSEACLFACGPMSDDARCTHCACANGCLDLFEACAGQAAHTCLAPEQMADVFFYSRSSQVGRSYQSALTPKLELVSAQRNLPPAFGVLSGMFDGDEFADVVLTNLPNEGADLYRGDGYGHFSLLESWRSWGSGWDTVLVGHFDEDRYHDLLLVELKSGKAQVLLSDGQGGLTKQDLQLIDGPWTTAVAGDFDGDSLSDVLFANLPQGRGTFYRNSQEGRLALLAMHQYWWSGWTAIVSGQFVGDDHKSDLLFYGSSGAPNVSGFLAIYEFLGDTQREWARLGSGVPGAARLIAGHFTADDREDVLLFDKTRGQVSVWDNQADGTLSNLSSVVYPEAHWRVVDDLAALPHP